MEQIDKMDVGNWVNQFDYNSAEEFIVEILQGKVAIEKMHDSVLQLRSGNLDDGCIFTRGVIRLSNCIYINGDGNRFWLLRLLRSNSNGTFP